ncbi:MAG: PleD family two-component system response regulator [Acidobacteria bacterium]|nr:PleD family two-component system response regulator [Acidobacteriota bacterium]
MNDNANKSNGEILIVDDNPINLDLLSGLLREHNYRVRAAINGRRALTAIRSCLPDLVMLDITMPEMDGYEVCRQIKADELTRDIPVIFISALDEVIDKVRAFEIGGVDYVTKPFQFGEVLVRIENQLKISRLQKEMERKNLELQQSYMQLERANRMLKALSYLDALTGIANRRHFDEALDQEWRRATRTNAPLSLVMIDIDFFKAFNDFYGHQGGDECLKQVAQVLSNTLKRAGDLAARYGGEEFAVVLPGTEAEGAAILADELRAKVESLSLEHHRAPSQIVTISLGVATAIPKEGISPESLIAIADRALYRSKKDGRNRVSIFDEAIDGPVGDKGTE